MVVRIKRALSDELQKGQFFARGDDSSFVLLQAHNYTCLPFDASLQAMLTGYFKG